MSTKKAREVRDLHVEELRILSCDFGGALDRGEQLIGTPTVEEITAHSLVISGEQVSTTELIINGRRVPAGEAVLFTLDAPVGAVGQVATLGISVNTDGPQTLRGLLDVSIVDDTSA